MSELFIISIVVLVASFCSCQSIDNVHITTAQKLCEPHGGLKTLNSDHIFSMEDYHANCVDGVSISAPMVKKN